MTFYTAPNPLRKLSLYRGRVYYFHVVRYILASASYLAKSFIKRQLLPCGAYLISTACWHFLFIFFFFFQRKQDLALHVNCLLGRWFIWNESEQSHHPPPPPPPPPFSFCHYGNNIWMHKFQQLFQKLSLIGFTFWPLSQTQTWPKDN